MDDDLRGDEARDDYRPIPAPAMPVTMPGLVSESRVWPVTGAVLGPLVLVLLIVGIGVIW